MKQNIKPLHIALFSTALLAGAATAEAQTQPKDSTLNRTVVVENDYDPQIMDANKINLLPDIEEPKPTKKEIVYAQTTHPFSAFRYRAMPSYAPKPTQPDATKCFINLGYGDTKNGNMTGEINYLFDLSDSDRLNVNAAFDGFNFDPDRTELEEWKSRFYQAQFKADYAHRFRTRLASIQLPPDLRHGQAAQHAGRHTAPSPLHRHIRRMAVCPGSRRGLLRKRLPLRSRRKQFGDQPPAERRTVIQP